MFPLKCRGLKGGLGFMKLYKEHLHSISPTSVHTHREREREREK
jgi:hypothetical protein